MLDDAPPPTPHTDPNHEAPRLLLRGLIQHDSWDLRERCRLRRRAAGAFLPLRRLVLRTLARASYEAGARRRPHVVWLDRCVDRAITELFEEQWTEEDLGAPLDPACDTPFYRFFSRAVGVEIERARLACVALNVLPRETRRAFFAVHLAGRNRKRHAAETCEPPLEPMLREARRAVRRALDLPGGRTVAVP